MSKEEKTTKNYGDYQFSPTNDVLVPFETYKNFISLANEVEKTFRKTVMEDKYSWYNNKTHKEISEATRKKLVKDGKLNERHYENINIKKTEESIHVQREPLSLFALKLLIEARNVFEHNVDKDNAVLIPKKDSES